MTKKPKVYRPSRLELLPLEIRERIYFHLGYPLGRRLLTTCRCTASDHWVDSRVCNGPFHYSGVPFYLNYGIQWSSIKSIELQSPRNGLLNGATFTHELETLGYKDSTWGLPHRNPALGALLSTNKFIAADLYTLLLRNIQAIFNFQPTNKAAFHYHKGYPRLEENMSRPKEKEKER